jgi:hypothetical protein
VQRIELLLQHQRAAVAHHRHQRVGAAEAPEERDPHPHAVGRSQVLPLADVPHVLDQAAVAELHPLGRGGGAGGVEDAGHDLRRHRAQRGIDLRVRPVPAQRRHVVERDRPRRALVARHHHAAQGGQARPARAAHLGDRVEEVLGSQARDRDQGADAAVGQHVLELARTRPGADRHQRGAQHGHREVDQQPLRPVGHHQSDPITRDDAEPTQPPGQLSRPAARLGVAEPLSAPHDQLVIRLARGQLVQ